MDRTTVPAEGAKLRLVTAAEELFARRGFEAVSVRDITKGAEMNIASVNYHFGSRDGLVAAVMARHLTPIFEESIVLLDRVERSGGPEKVLLEGLFDGWVRPVVNQVRRSSLPEPLACRLLGRMLGEQSMAMPPPVTALAKQAFARGTGLLGKVLPDVLSHDLAWRLHFLTGALSHALAADESLPWDAQILAGKMDLDGKVVRLARFALPGLGEGRREETTVEPPDSQATFNF
ncbi:MAG TPA: TetR/AcrR family transcriptional regulator [Luteolibacter sp.]